ncbi:MAG: thioredoxin domain-containing protein [Planctomycetota bacterium]|nr:thioredoxin domain-containing protein [Planctomycetota bacterium]
MSDTRGGDSASPHTHPQHPQHPRNPRNANRLIEQSSPYLLQHAHNPVDWHAWGEEAFAAARSRDVPLLVSIGYSTCYWCHVMERECFENESIAAQLNEHFVCVKVDREERPDVDDLCMNAILAMRGHGGWPLNVFLEPGSLRPFWAGTYLPPEPRHGMPSIGQVIEGISHAWRTDRGAVLTQAAHIADAVRERLGGAPSEARVGARHVTDAVGLLLRTHDAEHGGFGAAPKFPQPSFLELLLETREAADDATRGAIDHAIRRTLDAMMLGGIWDHVAGGFHRYSVDAQWTVPHFEKMLYDNAQLAVVYAKAARAFGDADYASVARRTCAYALREMQDARGLFCSAQDAEVDAREGLSYIWTPAEVREAITDSDDAAFALRVFGLDRGPNFRDPHHPSEPAVNVLRLDARVDASERERFERVCRVLYDARNRRKQPHRDDKVITAWNGLMIGALAICGELLADRAFINHAARVAGGLLAAHRRTDGLLLRSSRGAVHGPPGVLEDYAALAWGLAQVARATGEDRWRGEASGLIATAARVFGAGASSASLDGGLFDTPAAARDLFVRARSTHDGAMPSGQSLMLHALLDVHRSDDRDASLVMVRGLLGSLAGPIAESPIGVANATRGLFRVLRNAAWRQACAPTLEEPGEVAHAASNDEFTPVEVYASVERLTLPLDTPAEMTLLLRIAPGYHIIAAQPREDGDAESGRADDLTGLVPLRVHRLGGEGFEVYADYPRGTMFRGSPAVGGVRVLSGEVELHVALERVGAWTGNPLVGVTFQACRDDACLAATTVELDVAIDRA